LNKRPCVGVALCIRREGSVLIHLRKGTHAPGTWAFPGGHLEFFESFEESALRELREEAGNDLVVENMKLWTTINVKDEDEQKHCVVVFMVCDWVKGEPKVMEPEKCECWCWYRWKKLPSPLMMGLFLLKEANLDPFDL
jgi:8-oxo-dGTP diphosphatase